MIDLMISGKISVFSLRELYYIMKTWAI